jgi:hypothetical protein
VAELLMNYIWDEPLRLASTAAPSFIRLEFPLDMSVVVVEV